MRWCLVTVTEREEMRTLFSATIFVGFLAVSHSGFATVSDDDPKGPEEKSVLAVEDEYVAAELNRDEAALRRLIDDRFVFNSIDGSTLGKDALIHSVLAMKMTGQTITERTVTVDGDIAIVFGTAEIRTDETGEDERVSVLRYTSVYVKRQGQWRMLALQMAPRSPQQE